MVMVSTPAPIATSDPAWISDAARAIACDPEEQKRLTVTAAEVTGRPARSEATREMLLPCGPSGKAQPVTTSSTAAGSTPVRSSTARIRNASWSSGRVLLRDPRNALHIPIRALSTITARLIEDSNRVFPSGSLGHAALGQRIEVCFGEAEPAGEHLS